jgi:uncharacterized protein YdaU (DUF1376 family)
MHYYQFNIGDYKSHTEHLSDYEDLAYRRMLDWCYLHEKPLPNDVEEIARHIRLRSHCDCIAVVLREFFTQSPEGWINARVLQEIARTGEKSSKARESALARWTRDKDANALPTDSESNATHNTIHITHNTKKPRKRSVDQTLPEWLQSLNGEAPIPKDSAVLKFATSAGIPFDYIKIAWVHFKQIMTAKQKTQKDWRQTFNLYVQKDYMRLWAFNQNNECYLTTAGKQVQNSLQSEAA